MTARLAGELSKQDRMLIDREGEAMDRDRERWQKQRALAAEQRWDKPKCRTLLPFVCRHPVDLLIGRMIQLSADLGALHRRGVRWTPEGRILVYPAKARALMHPGRAVGIVWEVVTKLPELCETLGISDPDLVREEFYKRGAE